MYWYLAPRQRPCCLRESWERGLAEETRKCKVKGRDKGATLGRARVFGVRLRNHGKLLFVTLFPELSESWDFIIMLDPEKKLFYQEGRD